MHHNYRNTCAKYLCVGGSCERTGRPVASEFLVSGPSASRRCARRGRRSCDPEPRAGRAASRTHPSSPAGALTEGSEETRHTRPASWPLASWERRREEGKGLEKTSFSGTWGTCQKTGGQSLLRKRKVKGNRPETPNGGLRPRLGPGHDLCPSEDLCDRSAGLRCQGRWPVTSRFLAPFEQSPVCS